MSAHTHQSAPTDPADELAQKQQELEQALQEEVPETEMMKFIFGTSFDVTHHLLQKHAAISQAIQTLQHTDFIDHLLDVQDPTRFLSAVVAQRTLTKEFSRIKNKTPESVVSAGMWKWRHGISASEFDRRSQAVRIATAVHQHVSLQEQQQRLAAAAHVGLDQQRVGKLTQSYQEWQKDDKGLSFDQHLKKTLENLHTEQTGKSLSRSERKHLHATLDTQQGTIRNTVVTANEGMTSRARSIITEGLDSSRPAYTPEEVEAHIQSLTGQPAPTNQTPQPPPDDRRPPPPPPPAPTPTTPPSMPSTPAAPAFSFSLPSGIQNFLSGMSSRFASFSRGFSSFASKLGPVGSFLSGGLGGMLQTGLAGLGKLGLNALSTAAGGLPKAALAINSAIQSLTRALGIEVNVLGTTVKVIIGGIIFIVIGLPLLASSSDLFAPGQTYQIKASRGEEPAIGWNAFEEEFLVADRPENREQVVAIEWEQFEEHQLLSQRFSFSELTTHNVQPATNHP